jgi:hypothetical protein
MLSVDSDVSAGGPLAGWELCPMVNPRRLRSRPWALDGAPGFGAGDTEKSVGIGRYAGDGSAGWSLRYSTCVVTQDAT